MSPRSRPSLLPDTGGSGQEKARLRSGFFRSRRAEFGAGNRREPRSGDGGVTEAPGRADGNATGPRWGFFRGRRGRPSRVVDYNLMQRPLVPKRRKTGAASTKKCPTVRRGNKGKARLSQSGSRVSHVPRTGTSAVPAVPVLLEHFPSRLFQGVGPGSCGYPGLNAREPTPGVRCERPSGRLDHCRGATRAADPDDHCRAVTHVAGHGRADRYPGASRASDPDRDDRRAVAGDGGRCRFVHNAAWSRRRRTSRLR